MAATRRQLSFTSLDDIIQDAERLHAVGYEMTGQWDLAQISNHLACWVKYPMDGFPKLPFFLKPIFFVMKFTLIPKFEHQMRVERKMKAGMGTAPMTRFPPGQDEAAAVANLKNELTRMKAYTGPMHPSPLRGQLLKEDWVDSHLVHCAHHLSFLVPKA
jgi:hypothetical protein